MLWFGMFCLGGELFLLSRSSRFWLAGGAMGNDQSLIAASTAFLGIAKVCRVYSISCSLMDVAGFSKGARVTAENGGEDTPSIISLRYIWAKPRLTMSSAVNWGANS